jgi:hypothetical protein
MIGGNTMNEAIRPARNVELGASTEPFQNLHEFVRKARANLNQNAWDYIVGAAETETTMRRNRMALDEIAFRPRVLRNVAKVDASHEVMGRKLRLPVMLAPVGALEIFDPGGAASVVRGVGRFGAAHMLSSVSAPGLEKVAEAAPDALRIFQLYVRGDDAFVEDHVSRAIANGYTAFCLTVDTAHYSRRERDIAKRYVRESRARTSGGDFQKGLEWRHRGGRRYRARPRGGVDLRVEPRRTPTRSRPRFDACAARDRQGCCRPGQDHRRRFDLPRYRRRQSDHIGRRSCRHRPHAMLGACGERRGGRFADAGIARR